MRFFNHLAEIAAKHLQRGGEIYVEGSIRDRKWSDQHGTEHHVTEIIGKQLKIFNKSADKGEITAEDTPF